MNTSIIAAVVDCRDIEVSQAAIALEGDFATNCRSEWIAAVEDGAPEAGLAIWEDSNGSAETIDSETRDGGLAFVGEPADSSDLVVVVDELDDVGEDLGGQRDEHDHNEAEELHDGG